MWGKHEGTAPLGSPGIGPCWVDNITTNFKVVDYYFVSQDNNTWQVYLNTLMNLLVTYNSGNFFID